MTIGVIVTKAVLFSFCVVVTLPDARNSDITEDAMLLQAKFCYRTL